MIYKTDPHLISPYLKDGSNYIGGFADKVVIPESIEELSCFLKTNTQQITIAGAGTGMTASRIPLSGCVLSLERFDTVGNTDGGFIDVGPATSLENLYKKLEPTEYFYPPNPTETFASIGGTAATNASGSRSYKFGVTRDYVIEADIFFADGNWTTLKRGLTIDDPLEISNGQKILFPNISYKSPLCKNAAGYYVRPNMDWLDLFIGSDGTLGIFTRIRLKLKLSPSSFISGILFFDKEEECWDLVDSIKKSKKKFINPCSLEYFDRHSLNRLRKKFTHIPNVAQAALFFENDVNHQIDHKIALDSWIDYLGNSSVLCDSWFAHSDSDLKKFHEFRHAIPVLINEENSRLKRIKIGTDMAVSDHFFFDMLNFYKNELENSEIDYVVFGHLGDNHLHINLLPDEQNIRKAHNIYAKFVSQVLKWNGTVSAEHGIGKLKKKYFLEMVGEDSLAELKRIKEIFDPNFFLGKGNIF
jgi:D-lactate dehydrogenase (cytochrome)